jgi:hypothetical protein
MQRWAEIRAESQATGAEAVAHELNTTPGNVLQMLRTGKPLSNDEAGKTLFASTQKAASKFNGVEMQTMVRLLDAEPSIQPGRRNSSVMSDFIGSPKFATGITTYGQALGSRSIGEYLTNPMTAGATERNFIETRQSVLDAQAMVHQTDRQLAQNPSSNLMLKPISRTTMIMQAIPGVGKPGARKASTIRAEVLSALYGRYRLCGTRITEYSLPSRRFRDARGVASTKFEDPTMEAYRKQAVKGWEEHATAQQGFIERMIDSVFGDRSKCLRS